ncbi:MAG: hypothetical protein AB1767_01950 [Bacillota bacterium]
MRQTLSALLLGALAGGIIVTIYHASRLEQLYWENEKLKVALFDTTERLVRLESLWATHEQGEITAVNIALNGEIPAFTKLELTKIIHEITGKLVGERIDNLNPELLLSLLHNRKFTVEEKDYLLTVNWVVIAREIIFSLTASPAG